MKKPKAKKLTRSVQIKIDEDLFREVAEISDRNAVGISTVIRFAIPAGLEMVKAKFAEMQPKAA